MKHMIPDLLNKLQMFNRKIHFDHTISSKFDEFHHILMALNAEEPLNSFTQDLKDNIHALLQLMQKDISDSDPCSDYC